MWEKYDRKMKLSESLLYFHFLMVASFNEKMYTIYSFRNTRITGGIAYDRGNKLWRCGNSSG